MSQAAADFSHEAQSGELLDAAANLQAKDDHVKLCRSLAPPLEEAT